MYCAERDSASMLASRIARLSARNTMSNLPRSAVCVDLDVVLEIDVGVGLRVGMAPRRDVMSGGIEKGAEPELALPLGHGACPFAQGI